MCLDAAEPQRTRPGKAAADEIARPVGDEAVLVRMPDGALEPDGLHRATWCGPQDTGLLQRAKGRKNAAFQRQRGIAQRGETMAFQASHRACKVIIQHRAPVGPRFSASAPGGLCVEPACCSPIFGKIDDDRLGSVIVAVSKAGYPVEQNEIAVVLSIGLDAKLSELKLGGGEAPRLQLGETADQVY